MHADKRSVLAGLLGLCVLRMEAVRMLRRRSRPYARQLAGVIRAEESYNACWEMNLCDLFLVERCMLGSWESVVLLETAC